jgi:hypothetical protein
MTMATFHLSDAQDSRSNCSRPIALRRFQPTPAAVARSGRKIPPATGGLENSLEIGNGRRDRSVSDHDGGYH